MICEPRIGVDKCSNEFAGDVLFNFGPFNASCYVLKGVQINSICVEGIGVNAICEPGIGVDVEHGLGEDVHSICVLRHCFNALCVLRVAFDAVNVMRVEVYAICVRGFHDPRGGTVFDVICVSIIHEKLYTLI